MTEQMKGPADLLLGRKTFQIFKGYWLQHEDGWPGINSITKYVASNTLRSSDWNNTVFLSGNLAEKVRELKHQDGMDLHVYGSGNLIQQLLANDLVDELWLKIFPITLGKGKRLFDSGAIPAAFTLTESKISPLGVIIASYRRAGEVKTGSF